MTIAITVETVREEETTVTITVTVVTVDAVITAITVEMAREEEITVTTGTAEMDRAAITATIVETARTVITEVVRTADAVMAAVEAIPSPVLMQ